MVYLLFINEILTYHLTPGSFFYRTFTIKRDTMWAIKYYGKNRLAAIEALEAQEEKEAQEAQKAE